MNIQSQAVTSALALFPVYLPRWKTPVQPAGLAHGGIPGAAFTPNDLEVVIEPFTALKTFVMAAFDVVTLYVNGVATNVAKTILPGEENDRFLLLLPSKWFVDGVNGIFYRVTRVSGNSEDSISLTVLYHDPAPGEPAPAGVTIVFPPNIVANGVGPAEAAAGVLATFIISFARPFDEIHLSVGTWSTTFTVTDPAKPITLTLTTADFLKIGDNANTPVKCTVTDQLGNGNQSATTYLNIHLAAIAPTIDSVKGDGIEVPNGTETKSTSVSLQGIVTSGHQVQIYDNDAAKHTVTAVGKNWITTLSVLLGDHSITAKALSTGEVSNTRSFRVISPILPLKIASLTASPHSNAHVFAVNSGFPRTGFNGARFRIDIEAGVPPYTFSSSSEVNQIDPTTGVVTIRGKDQAVFTVRDSVGSTAVFTMQSLPLFFSVPAKLYHNYAYASAGGRLPTIAQMTAATVSNPSPYIRAVGSLFGEWGNLMADYGWPEGGVGAGQQRPDINHYWTSQPAPDQGNFYIVSPKSGSVGAFWREWQVPCTYVI